MKTRKHLLTFVVFILRLMSAEFSCQIFILRSSAPANENKYNSVEIYVHIILIIRQRVLWAHTVTLMSTASCGAAASLRFDIITMLHGRLTIK